MFSEDTTPIHNVMKWATMTLGTFCLVIVTYAIYSIPMEHVEGRILSRIPETVPWRVFTADEIEAGATLPGGTNVVFHLPLSFDHIERGVFFGFKGESVRYWGYCFPQNYVARRRELVEGFPGKMFLSERERFVRAEALRPRVDFSRLPTTKDELDQSRRPAEIRHQLEIFQPGALCYFMSERPITVGLDPDNDRLNSELERVAGTDPDNSDTDQDSLWDGIEYFTQTDPLRRDTDGDGLIDGIEDSNFDGNIDGNETDPRHRDTDSDGLCDGLCEVKLANNQRVLLGEDRNLNGVLDAGETDPRLWDTNRDGASDYAAYFNCQGGMDEFCIGSPNELAPGTFLD